MFSVSLRTWPQAAARPALRRPVSRGLLAQGKWLNTLTTHGETEVGTAVESPGERSLGQAPGSRGLPVDVVMTRMEVSFQLLAVE